MPGLVIRRADLTDADDLGVIGPASYLAAYDYLWDDPAALLRHLRTFNAQAFREVIRRSDARVWVAEFDGSVAGFLTMFVNSRDPVLAKPHGAEIPRIYLLPMARGQGLGRRLFESAVDQARSEGMDHVWLDVMASADWAIGAYQRWGFCPIGTDRFEKGVKPELADMIVLSMPVGHAERIPTVPIERDS